MKNEPFYTYMNALNDLDKSIDFARMRAYELKGLCQNALSEEPSQQKRQLQAAINVEMKQIQGDLIEAISKLEKIKQMQIVDYQFTK